MLFLRRLTQNGTSMSSKVFCSNFKRNGTATAKRLLMMKSEFSSSAIAVRYSHSVSFGKEKNTSVVTPVFNSSARRAQRRRRSLTEMYKAQQTNKQPQVMAMAKAEAFDLWRIVDDNVLSHLYQITFVDDDNEDTLHITAREEYRIKDLVKDAFIFTDGVIVTWNMDTAETNQLIDLLQPFEQEPYNPTLTQQETESMVYNYTNGSRVFIKNDVINLSKELTENMDNSTEVLTRYALSQGLAASVKVAIWERQLNEYAEPLNATTKSLTRGVIPWKRRETLQRTGQFAALRQSINLDSGLLNADFYWEREDLKQHYTHSLRYFEVNKRLKDLNTRLDHCQNLVNVIDNMLTHRHASFLEITIILLIVIEVIFDVLHYFDIEATPVFMVDDPRTNGSPTKPNTK
ncbi:DUF155 domain-containing protein [Aphelenchoides besseyi]|nr:DUF155 domain-containing protein [Aphelenchoides besseyi]